MRVTAVACLVSSGLMACAATAAVAAAESEGSDDVGRARAARPTAGESSGRPARSAPTVSRTVTQPRSVPSGPRSPARDPWPAEGADGEGDSKLPQPGAQAVEIQLEDPTGEQRADPAAADQSAEATIDEDSDGEEGDGKDDGEDGEDIDDECGGWWLFPPDRGLPVSADGGGYDAVAPSVARPPGLPPALDIAPAADLLPEFPVVAVPPDLPVPPAVLAAVPVVSLPVLVPPPVVSGIGGNGAGTGPRGSAATDGGREAAESPGLPAQRPVPSRDSDATLPASYRAGYGEFLRTAGMPQVAAVAVPGATAIMLLTGAGGLIGYRQARAGHAIRAGAAGRFSS